MLCPYWQACTPVNCPSAPRFFTRARHRADARAVGTHRSDHGHALAGFGGFLQAQLHQLSDEVALKWLNCFEWGQAQRFRKKEVLAAKLPREGRNNGLSTCDEPHPFDRWKLVHSLQLNRHSFPMPIMSSADARVQRNQMGEATACPCTVQADRQRHLKLLTAAPSDRKVSGAQRTWNLSRLRSTLGRFMGIT